MIQSVQTSWQLLTHCYFLVKDGLEVPLVSLIILDWFSNNSSPESLYKQLREETIFLIVHSFQILWQLLTQPRFLN